MWHLVVGRMWMVHRSNVAHGLGYWDPKIKTQSMLLAKQDQKLFKSSARNVLIGNIEY